MDDASVFVVKSSVVALITLALLEVAADLAAPMVAEVAGELGITTAEVWKVLVLGVALFVLANLKPQQAIRRQTIRQEV